MRDGQVARQEAREKGVTQLADRARFCDRGVDTRCECSNGGIESIKHSWRCHHDWIREEVVSTQPEVRSAGGVLSAVLAVSVRQ